MKYFLLLPTVMKQTTLFFSWVLTGTIFIILAKFLAIARLISAGLLFKVISIAFACINGVEYICIAAVLKRNLVPLEQELSFI